MDGEVPVALQHRPLRRNTLSLIFFGLISLIVLWAAVRVLTPFITPILLAAIVVTFTHPQYRRLRARLGGRETLSAVLMLLGVTLVIILPAFLLLTLLIDQATDLFRLIQKTDFPAIVEKLEIRNRLTPLTRIIPGFDPHQVKFEGVIIAAVQKIPAFVATHGGVFLAGLVNVVLGFLLMLLAAFYFYVDGERLLSEMRILSPLPDEYDQEIFSRFRSVVDATFRGQMLTALAQGTVTAIGLWIAGIPGPLFWGAVAAVFSLIPMVGAAAVWVPATIYLFLNSLYRDSSFWPGIFLAAWGVLVVSLVDNLIRPWAMRGKTKMPAVLLFFAILGGLQAFGVVGLILGPLVFALLVPLIDIYKTIQLDRELDARAAAARVASEPGPMPPTAAPAAGGPPPSSL